MRPTIFFLASLAPMILSAAVMLPDVWSAKSEIRSVEQGVRGLRLTGERKGDFYHARLTNAGSAPVHVREVALFRIAHQLPGGTRLYGESFQMLSQTGGTLDRPVDLGYDELKHYKIPQPPDARVVTGTMTLTPPGSDTMLLGFTSSRRFSGRFYLRRRNPSR